MRVWRVIFGILLAFAAGVPSSAAPDSASAPHVRVQLMTGESGVTAPGQSVAGLYFKLESGWHVYWKTPGDAGQPPKIVWTMPNGVKAGPLQFPAPKRLPLGPLMDFGYADEVLFTLTMSGDSSFNPGSTVHPAARASGLFCRETCIPEKANLDLDLPVMSATPGGNANTALFQ